MRKDMMDYLLERDYHFAKSKNGVAELIWVRVTLMQTEKHDFTLSNFKKLLPIQRVNRFPLSTQQINQKDVFAKNVQRMKAKFGEKVIQFTQTQFSTSHSIQKHFFCHKIGLPFKTYQPRTRHKNGLQSQFWAAK
jgi:hypothetical protein